MLLNKNMNTKFIKSNKCCKQQIGEFRRLFWKTILLEFKLKGKRNKKQRESDSEDMMVNFMSTWLHSSAQWSDQTPV